MSELTNGAYAEIQKGVKGIKTYLKFSRLDAYELLKLMQFIKRAAKENIVTQGYTEEFTDFLRKSKGDFQMYRMPYKENKLWLDAKGTIQQYLDKAGITYCIQDSVNPEDKAVHVCVQSKDVAKFNMCYAQYIRDNLTGGELSGKDLLNFTDGKTSIVSVPDAAAQDMVQAFKALDINFSDLPDLMPGDGEKQFRVATSDLNMVEQAYNIYKHKLLANTPGGEKQPEIPEMTVMNEQQYLNTASETPEAWMDSVTDDVKERMAEYNQIPPDETEKEIIEYSHEIRPSTSADCVDLKNNDDFVMISIDHETLVKDCALYGHLKNSEYGKDAFACIIPYTGRKMSLMLNKRNVFEVKGESKIRYIAFLEKDKVPRVFINGRPDAVNNPFQSGEDIFKQFDEHNNKNWSPQRNKAFNPQINSRVKSPKPKIK